MEKKNEIIDVEEQTTELDKGRGNRFSYEPPQWLKGIRKHIYIGLIAALLITFVWFLTTDMMRGVAIAILITAAVIFFLRAVLGIVIAKKPGKIRLMANTIFVLFTVIVFFSVTILTVAPKFLFCPNFDEEAYAALSEIEAAEELSIKTEHGVLNGWFLHQSDAPAPLVLYMEGNGGNSSEAVKNLLESPEKIAVFNGCHFACIDYPSYGKSEGEISDDALRQYALEVYDYLINRQEVTEIIVMGYSLGTGVANYLASQRDVAGLILMAPYADGYDLYNGMVNVFYGPLRLLVTYKMDAVEYAKSVEIKPLILASPMDEVVSYNSSQRLFQAYPNGCNFVTVDGISHNSFWKTQIVLDKIAEYIKER
ncbi:MAG: alpha/beta hydrolase [Lachnospiraceae bacterium]|nr:alpha/beta hydrolase [Lachnospiraceae bacterium]